jgi:hypothetical protein
LKRIKSSLILLFSLLLVFQCVAQQELRGLWSSDRVEYRPTPGCADAAFDVIYHHSDLYFEGDTVWQLELPCKRLNVRTYFSGDFAFQNDSTFEYGGEKYVIQRVYDSSAIQELKLHALNSECYSGKWFLVRSESGGDGTGVDFIFPYKIKDPIFLQAGDLDGKVFELRMAGAERTFYFELVRSDFENQLILTPTESSKEKVMWTSYWGQEPLRKKELKALKQTEGIPLELRFRRI